MTESCVAIPFDELDLFIKQFYCSAIVQTTIVGRQIASVLKSASDLIKFNFDGAFLVSREVLLVIGNSLLYPLVLVDTIFGSLR
jgi:hypothetical protein